MVRINTNQKVDRLLPFRQKFKIFTQREIFKQTLFDLLINLNELLAYYDNEVIFPARLT